MTDQAWSPSPTSAPLQLQLQGAPARHIVAVIQSQRVGPSFHRLRLSNAAIARWARPGQFVHVLPHLLPAALPSALPSGAASEECWQGAPTESHDPLLRRAFSIMSSSRVSGAAAGQDGEAEDSEWFEILFRVGGRGTSLLARSQVGDRLDVLGPLGNGFTPAETPALQTPEAQLQTPEAQLQTPEAGRQPRPLLLVGGGIGVPPLIFAAQQARADAARGALAPGIAKGGTGSGNHVAVEAFVGARTAAELVGLEVLAQAGAQVHIATDDGSQGQRGLVTLPLRERLQELLSAGAGSTVALPQKRQLLPSLPPPLPPLVCACGPWPMLKAVARLCESMGVQCRVSLEENMPCGVGVCNGCVVPVLNAIDDYGRFQRICIHGPVLDARTVDWGDAVVPPSLPGHPARFKFSPS